VELTLHFTYASSDIAQFCSLSVMCQILNNTVAIFSIAVLLPLFSTSSGAGTVTSLERLTLINAQDRYSMVWIVFFFTVMYSMLGHILLYFFDEKRKSFSV